MPGEKPKHCKYPVVSDRGADVFLENIYFPILGRLKDVCDKTNT